MEYGGYPGAGMPAAPGMLGSTMMGMGYGSPYGTMTSQMALGQQQGAMQFGGGAMNFLGNAAIPGAIGAASMGAWTVAPMLQSGGGVAGRAVGRAWSLMDPFTWAGPGWKAGTSFGAQSMGIGGFMGQGFKGLLNASTKRFGLAGGLGRIAGMGAMGIGAGLAATIPYFALAAGAKAAGHQVWQGAEASMAAQAMTKQMQASAFPGQGTGGAGGFGQELMGISRELGVGMEDLSSMMQVMDHQKVFQTTTNVREFRQRFKEVLDAVKEVAKATQTTLDEAQGVFGELRQQGFYTTADVTAQAVKTQARAATTGISRQAYTAIGGVGAQTARQYGMRGRIGSEIMARSVAGISMGVRSGSISEEAVMEMGGVEAVGMRSAQQQMGFLSSARGTAIIAAMMGEGGAPDPTRMNQLMGGGMTMESIVTGAAGRGLGVLRAAQGREAREQFAPYAQMAMIQMAAAQSRQIYGGASRKNIRQMLGTMGVGWEESDVWLNDSMGRARQIQQEAAASQTSTERSRYEERMRTEGFLAQNRKFWIEPGEKLLEGIGAGMYAGISGKYRESVDKLTGYREYKGTDDYSAARKFAQSGRDLGWNVPEKSLFGLKSPGTRIYETYGRPYGAKKSHEIDQGAEGDQYVYTGSQGALVNIYGARTDRVIKNPREAWKDFTTPGNFVSKDLIKEVDRGHRLGKGFLSEGERAALGEIFLTEGNRGRKLFGGGLSEDRMGELSKRLGLTDKDWGDLSPGQQEMITTGIEEVASKYDIQVRASGSAFGAISEYTAAGARQYYEKELRGEFGSYKMGGKEYGSTLGKTVARNADVQGKVSALLENMATGGDYKERERLLSDLKSELSMGEWNHFSQYYNNIKKDPEKKKQLRKDLRENTGVFGKIGGAQLTDKMLRESEQASDIAATMLESGEDLGFDRTGRDALRRLQGAAGKTNINERRREYEAGLSDLWSNAYLSGKGIEGKEMGSLTNLGGDAVSFDELVTGVASGDSGTLEALADKGYNVEELESELAGVKSLQVKQSRVSRWLISNGLTPTDLGGGDTSTQVGGVDTEYIKANTGFVTAVHKFTSAMSKIPGLGIEVVPGPDADPRTVREDS